MPDIYGFGDEPEPVKISTLTKDKKRKHKIDRQSVEAAASAGEEQGFVDRAPSRQKKINLKPGRKRTEEQDRVTITGPRRVIDRLKRLSQESNLPMWQVLEAGLEHIQIDLE